MTSTAKKLKELCPPIETDASHRAELDAALLALFRRAAQKFLALTDGCESLQSVHPSYDKEVQDLLWRISTLGKLLKKMPPCKCQQYLAAMGLDDELA